MTLQQIKYFVEVTATQRFTVAANNLFIAQSSLSYSISELEHELGVPLFIRNANKKVTLTEYGKAFLPHAKDILNSVDVGFRELKSMQDPTSGTVTMGFFYCVANSEIPSIFRRFNADYPDSNIFIDVDVNQGSGSIDADIQTGKYDMIISTSDYIRDCSSTRIGRQKLKLIVPNNHPLAKNAAVSINAILSETLIGINPGSNVDIWIRDMFRQCNAKPDIYYVPDWSTQFTKVSMGYGIAISPSMPYNKEYLAELDIDSPMVWRNLYLSWPENRKLSKAAETVRDYIVKLTETTPLEG